MTRNEKKYVNWLKEENEKIKILLVLFMDGLRKARDVEDITRMMMIPLMTEENKKVIAEIKAEAIKEFAERLKEKSWPDDSIYPLMVVNVDEIDNLVKKMVGDEK